MGNHHPNRFEDERSLLGWPALNWCPDTRKAASQGQARRRTSAATRATVGGWSSMLA